MSKTALRNKMLVELGFKNLRHFKSIRNISAATRYRYYTFTWRLIMRKYSLYRVMNSNDWESLEGFHTEYEDYVLKNCRGSRRNWSKASLRQYEYLTRKLVKRWKVIKHANLLFTIKDPNGITWFRALDLDEFFKALNICYRKGQGPVRSIIYKHGLKWNECVAIYKKKLSKGRPLWTRFDLDISLIIAEKIITTFSPQTGVWQTGGNKWALLVMKHLSLNEKTRFQDIINIVSAAGMKSISKAVYAIALFWGVGGSKAVNVIKGAYKRNNIPEWWH